LKEIFKQLIVDSQRRSYGPIIERDYEIPTETKKIVSLIGVRRSGKTWLLYRLIEKLRKNVAAEKIAHPQDENHDRQDGKRVEQHLW
jgi:predicted AAA+ superfamily ATPase